MVKRLEAFVILVLLAAGCDAPQSGVQTYFTPGPECENNIIAELNATKNTADIAVYSITNQRITNAVLAAHNRGVRIRVITDRAQAKIKNASAPKLRNAGIDVVTNVKHKIMHHKFAIFDGRRVVSGSYNWTENASTHNAENCEFFAAHAPTYTHRFEHLWHFYSN